ncbi:MAG TPA: site-specific integrase, partial [Actinomycetospora sp.]|nr:site-specific integrase [Actinomycetospora sp.]
MARPPLPLGTPGTISVVEEEPGSWVARCRFRDHDGVTRRLRKHGSSKTAAKAALHELIQQRQRGTFGNVGGLTPASRFHEAAELYL